MIRDLVCYLNLNFFMYATLSHRHNITCVQQVHDFKMNLGEKSPEKTWEKVTNKI